MQGKQTLMTSTSKLVTRLKTGHWTKNDHWTQNWSLDVAEEF